MMIRLAVENGHGAINLFDKQQANHLVRECHLAQGDFFLGHFVYVWGKPVRTAHYEDEPAGCGSHALLHPLGKVYTPSLSSMWIP